MRGKVLAGFLVAPLVPGAVILFYAATFFGEVREGAIILVFGSAIAQVVRRAV